MKYTSKQALLDDIRSEHDSLCARLRTIPRVRWRETGVWGDDWTLSDLVAHLAEWQRMFLGWYEVGLRGATPEMPAPGYKWNETPRLNRAIWEKNRSRSVASIEDDFEAGYVRILELVEALPSEQLLVPGHFRWTAKHPLATYLGPNTASHYRFATKSIKRWLKGDARPRIEPHAINAAWHQVHRMPARATLDERIVWHLSHLEACACRTDLPASILAELKRRGIEPARSRSS